MWVLRQVLVVSLICEVIVYRIANIVFLDELNKHE